LGVLALEFKTSPSWLLSGKTLAAASSSAPALLAACFSFPGLLADRALASRLLEKEKKKFGTYKLCSAALNAMKEQI
jgi:hypothetical protein